MPLLSRLAACLVWLAAATSAAVAEPGLWVVKDKDSTIYLFGTVHALRPDTVWRTPKLDKAIASAQQLWLEIPSTDEQALAGQMAPLVAKYGVLKDRTLADLLTPEEYKTLNEAAAVVGAPAGVFDHFRPWFAAVGISGAEIKSAGYDPESGVDRKIEGVFKARGVTPNGLESVEDQIMVFADMTPEVELNFLRETLKEFRKAAAELDGMVDAWAAGDVPALEKLFVSEMKEEDDGLYQRLLVDRNTRWAAEINDMLKGQGVIFIAVGAGHLVGPDSVQAQLAKLGVRATRE